jgi:hypothetical protein
MFLAAIIAAFVAMGGLGCREDERIAARAKNVHREREQFARSGKQPSALDAVPQSMREVGSSEAG